MFRPFHGNKDSGDRVRAMHPSVVASWWVGNIVVVEGCMRAPAWLVAVIVQVHADVPYLSRSRQDPTEQAKRVSDFTHLLMWLRCKQQQLDLLCSKEGEVQGLSVLILKGTTIDDRFWEMFANKIKPFFDNLDLEHPIVDDVDSFFVQLTIAQDDGKITVLPTRAWPWAPTSVRIVNLHRPW